MATSRRGFLGMAGLAALAGFEPGGGPRTRRRRHRRSGGGQSASSTYSFWQFRGERLGMLACLDKAAAMGFDGVELLHIQMADESPKSVNEIKKRAHSLGLALMGFSTHQGFVYPERGPPADERPEDAVSDRAGRQPRHPDDADQHRSMGDGQVVRRLHGPEGDRARPSRGTPRNKRSAGAIGAIEKLLPTAEASGVVLGPGESLGPGPDGRRGSLRIVEAIKSPWLQMTLDTGNFLENSYSQMEQMASSSVPIALVQAKTYYGGGRWYALDLDYARIAKILEEHQYKGWISLEFEGNDDAEVGVPKSLAMLKEHFG